MGLFNLALTGFASKLVVDLNDLAYPGCAYRVSFGF